MEDWGETQESMKADINELKDRMSQILEALATLKSTEDNPTTHEQILKKVINDYN